MCLEMLQSGGIIEILGLILIALGVIVIIVGIYLMTKTATPEDQTIRKESKGVILLGPIPIIWGFGKRHGELL